MIGVGCYFIGHYFVKKIYRKIKKYPDGFVGLPLLGSMISFGNDMDKFMEYQTYYGEISMCTMGIHNCVVLNSSNLVKQVFKNDQAIDRLPTDFISKCPLLGNISSDIKWKLRRKILMKSFIATMDSKTVTNGVNDSFNNIVKPKIDELIRNNNGVYVARDDLLFLSLKSIFKHMTNDDIEKYPKLAKDIAKYVNNWFQYFTDLLGVALFPALLPLFKLMGTLKNFNDAEEGLVRCGNKIIEIRQHMKKSNNYDENIHTLVDDVMASHVNKTGKHNILKIYKYNMNYIYLI